MFLHVTVATCINFLFIFFGLWSLLSSFFFFFLLFFLHFLSCPLLFLPCSLSQSQSTALSQPIGLRRWQSWRRNRLRRWEWRWSWWWVCNLCGFGCREVGVGSSGGWSDLGRWGWVCVAVGLVAVRVVVAWIWLLWGMVGCGFGFAWVWVLI